MAINDIYRELNWLWKQTEGSRTKIFMAGCLDFITMILSLVSIYFSKTAIDIATGAQEGNLLLAASAMVALIVGSSILATFYPWLSERAFMKIQIALQERLMSKAVNASWTLGSKWHSGDMANRLTIDTDRCVNLMVYTLPAMFVTFLKLLISFAFLCYLDTRVAFIVLFSTPFLLLSKLYYRRLRALSTARKEIEGKIESVIQESLVNRFLISALGISGERAKLLHEEQVHGFDVGVSQIKLGMYSKGVLRFVFTGGYCITFLMGLHYLSMGSISFGVMTAFIQLVSRIQRPTLALISFVPALIRVQASVDRLLELDDVEQNPQRRRDAPQKISGMSVMDLGFAYGDKLVLEHIAFTLKPGESLAVVGPTGAGKTTLMKLLMGIFKPLSGRIEVQSPDGNLDVMNISLQNYCYVPQGNSMFSGTIRNNLSCVNVHANEDLLREVLHLAEADFVFSLPLGLDTDLGEKGLGLSEGQLQRLSIARALLSSGSICIFDEITSALDADTSARLMDNLLCWGKNRMMFFVTHDMILAQKCDHILNIQKTGQNGIL